jgi:hypothetical protein
VARHIVLDDPAILDDPEVEALIAVALERAKKPMDPNAPPGRLVIRSVSAKQRPRRPGA